MTTLTTPVMTTSQLMGLVAETNKDEATKSEMTATERALIIELLKERGREELDFGQELVFGGVKLVKRVTGTVSIFFNS